MKYPVVVHKSEYGYDVHCPLLPGCHSQGDTVEEALENIVDAIKTYLAMVSEEEQGS
jgi:predicted RNase H-like HicB family nuclease